MLLTFVVQCHVLLCFQFCLLCIYELLFDGLHQQSHGITLNVILDVLASFLQAFNILLDGHNGFTGLTSSLLEILHDDYPNKSSICWPLFQPLYNSINEGRVSVQQKSTALMHKMRTHVSWV